MPSVRLYAPAERRDTRGAIVSFNVKGVGQPRSPRAGPPRGRRAGAHCAQPLLRHIGAVVCRASVAAYTTMHDIDRFLEAGVVPQRSRSPGNIAHVETDGSGVPACRKPRTVTSLRLATLAQDDKRAQTPGRTLNEREARRCALRGGRGAKPRKPFRSEARTV
ncbi:MAG: aminotransferase class V-fold PLP-dependent enzyme [Eggerthella lenta]